MRSFVQQLRVFARFNGNFEHGVREGIQISIDSVSVGSIIRASCTISGK